MNVKIDHDEFDKRQRRLLQEIVSDVRNRLEEMGLGEDQELVESLVFDIAAIFDGSRVMESDGKSLRPFLTFVDDRKGEELIAVEGGSWMHEISGGIVKQIFENDSSDTKSI